MSLTLDSTGSDMMTSVTFLNDAPTTSSHGAFVYRKHLCRASLNYPQCALALVRTPAWRDGTSAGEVEGARQRSCSSKPTLLTSDGRTCDSRTELKILNGNGWGQLLSFHHGRTRRDWQRDLNWPTYREERSCVASAGTGNRQVALFEHGSETATHIHEVKKPFDVCAEGLLKKNSRGDGIRTMRRCCHVNCIRRARPYAVGEPSALNGHIAVNMPESAPPRP